jgi:uncharacterized membrane protein YbaN (DUF454 family)
MTRKKLDVIGWIFFAFGVVLLSLTRLPGVVVMILACVCFVLSRLGRR